MTVADPCLGHVEGTLLLLSHPFDQSADALGEGGKLLLRLVQDAAFPGEGGQLLLLVGVPQAGRPRLSPPPAAPGLRQLRHPQAPCGPGLARPPPPHPAALHPTSASWLNRVEVFFSIVDRQALRRGDFTSVTDLIAAISRFCTAWNQRCQPFSWTKPADEILSKLDRQTTQRRSTSSHSRRQG
jgi:hypothetical protein